MSSNIITKANPPRLSNEEANIVSKASLQRALVRLMKHKDIDDITITELVKESGVSRATFYRNYQSKEDIINDFCCNVINIIISSLDNEEFKNNHKSWYKHLFLQIKQNSRILELLSKAKLKILNLLIEKQTKRKYTQEEYYRLCAFATGLEAIVFTWLSTGMKEPISEMAEICNKTFDQLEILMK